MFARPQATTGQVLAPVSPLWVAPSRDHSVTVTVRNTGAWTWGRATVGSYGREYDDVQVRLIEPDPYRDCGPLLLPATFGVRYPTAKTAVYQREAFGSRPARPGATGDFVIPLCANPEGGERSVRLRLESVGPGGTTAGPEFSIAIRRDEPPAAAFSWTPATDPIAQGTSVQFTDASTADRGIASRAWNFGDPDSGAANTSTAGQPGPCLQRRGNVRGGPDGEGRRRPRGDDHAVRERRRPRAAARALEGVPPAHIAGSPFVAAHDERRTSWTTAGLTISVIAIVIVAVIALLTGEGPVRRARRA